MRQYSEYSDFFPNTTRTRVQSRYRPPSTGVHSGQMGWTRRKTRTGTVVWVTHRTAGCSGQTMIGLIRTHSLSGQSRCQVYLSMVRCFGSTFDGALANLTLIFERLRSYVLQLKSTKCHLFRSSVPFLGHIVGDEGWSTTRPRSRTSNHGRSLIASRAYASSWDLWATTGGLFRILLTSRRLW